MTKALEIDRKDGLYVTDAEIIRRWGVGEKTGRVALTALEKTPGFPRKRQLFGGRRYWPAVKQFIDTQEGVSLSSPAAALAPEAEENW